MDNNGFNYFENSRYIDNRTQRKTLILDVNDSASTDIDIGASGIFKLKLSEPFSIDKHSDVFLDSFTTINSMKGTDQINTDNMAFKLKIDQFNLNPGVNNDKMMGSIIIPNECSDTDKFTIHKAKKLNYVCSINPCKLTEISGIIQNIADTPSFIFNASGTGRFISEFVIISKKD